MLISLRRLERLDKDEYTDDERQEAEEVSNISKQNMQPYVDEKFYGLDFIQKCNKKMYAVQNILFNFT